MVSCLLISLQAAGHVFVIRQSFLTTAQSAAAAATAASASDSAATCCGFAAKAAQKYLPQKFVQLCRLSNCPFVQASPQQLPPSTSGERGRREEDGEIERTETGLAF